MSEDARQDAPELIQPRPDWQIQAVEYFTECVARGVSDLQGMLEVTRDRWEEYLRRVESDRGGPWLDQSVPQSHYWFVRGDRIIGRIRLRHRLNERLQQEGGNIGYDVRPSEWGKGHATRMLSLMLPIAREAGLDRALLTCDDDNPASARVIEKNGGVLQDVILSPKSGKPHRRYWIDLQ